MEEGASASSIRQELSMLSKMLGKHVAKLGKRKKPKRLGINKEGGTPHPLPPRLPRIAGPIYPLLQNRKPLPRKCSLGYQGLSRPCLSVKISILHKSKFPAPEKLQPDTFFMSVASMAPPGKPFTLIKIKLLPSVRDEPTKNCSWTERSWMAASQTTSTIQP